MKPEGITRRKFLFQGSALLSSLAIPQNLKALSKQEMKEQHNFDVIIIGGSYSGLAAGLALGRALRNILIIDSGNPCNKQTPLSHNFLTHDGHTPISIATSALEEVKRYKTVSFITGLANRARKIANGFEVALVSGENYSAKKLIFATGIKDKMPDIEGFSQCWGISALHCPYCHGYEVRDQETGILANGDAAYEFGALISNWTKNLIIFTNGKSTLTNIQMERLRGHNIELVEDEIRSISHKDGFMDKLVFKNGNEKELKTMYSKRPFEQHSSLAERLGCELTDEGYIRISPFHRTTVDGIFACGDNVTRMRTVANAISMGTTTGMMVNKELIEETF
jgi:thioredoxin reductase